MSIKITINPDGSFNLDTTGYKGASCEEAVKWLENEVGKFEDVTKKAEYYDVEQQQKTKQWGKL
jgi:hypothetical protein